jgi:alcohol dehydrogenase
MVADEIRVPYADHMLVPVPPGVDPLRVAAASDNLADAWRAIVPPLRACPGGSVLVIGGGAQSIGLYAAALAARNGAGVVHYLDDDVQRLAIAESLGVEARRLTSRRRGPVSGRYDVAVEASSRADGVRAAVRALNPGGVCTAVGYYLSPNTRVPLMRMYATDATLRLGVSSVRPVLPELLDFVARTDFPAELITTLVADWEDAPTAYAARTTKLVLQRPPVDLTG